MIWKTRAPFPQTVINLYPDARFQRFESLHFTILPGGTVSQTSKLRRLSRRQATSADHPSPQHRFGCKLLIESPRPNENKKAVSSGPQCSQWCVVLVAPGDDYQALLKKRPDPAADPGLCVNQHPQVRSTDLAPGDQVVCPHVINTCCVINRHMWVGRQLVRQMLCTSAALSLLPP